MSNMSYRTEDLTLDEIMEYFVETEQDRLLVNQLKSINPTILIASRGAGKTFLLRVAEAELLASFAQDRIFPVYLTFTKSSLIQTSDPKRFQYWMLARICSQIVRSLSIQGIILPTCATTSVLTGGLRDISGDTPMEKITKKLEDSWKNFSSNIDTSSIPSIEEFKCAIDDMCGLIKIKRFALFIDEAAHIFIPEQQRQFFTLFRDMRGPRITCNAAVYPGVTYYGDVFQPAHDATMISVDRNVLLPNYIENMKEIIMKRADSNLATNIAKNGKNFAVLAYASTGNPRILIKIVSKAQKINSQQVNEVIREYFRTDIWSEHSTLGGKYTGHEELINWGRKFIEEDILPELQKKNNEYLASDKKTTCFFWIHRKAPQSVHEAIRLLAYTGIVNENGTGIKATRSEIGTRYIVNLGCLISLEKAAASSGFDIAKGLDPRRMSEYGMNNSAYSDLPLSASEINDPDMNAVLRSRLETSADVLDLTPFLKGKLRELHLNSIGDVINASENQLQTVALIGEKRARMMHNSAMAAVYEYLSG